MSSKKLVQQITIKLKKDHGLKPLNYSPRRHRGLPQEYTGGLLGGPETDAQSLARAHRNELRIATNYH